MQEEVYIVTKGPILGPPKTKRAFQKGEAVTIDDFTGCEDEFRTLAVSGGLKLASAGEAEMGHRIRQRHDQAGR